MPEDLGADETITLVASAAATPRRAVGTGGSAAYWLFDEPGIERSWRDYLKTADRWLNVPQDAFRDVWEGKPTTR